MNICDVFLFSPLLDLNGVRKKLLNSNLARKYGWKSKGNILQKLKQTFESYKD